MTTTCTRPGCTRAAYSRTTGLCKRHFTHLAGDAYDIVPFPTEQFAAYLDAGYPPKTICIAAGVDDETASRAYPNGNVYRWVRDALINVDLETAASQPAWRTTRRIRALAAAGMTYTAISKESGLCISGITKLATGQPKRTSLETFTKINTVWHNHRNDPVKTPDARIARRGWAKPWEWDDIDGPDDLHADAMVTSRYARAALKRAVAKWGKPHTLTITQITPSQYSAIHDRPTVRESIHSRVLGNLNRETQRLHVAQKHANRKAA